MNALPESAIIDQLARLHAAALPDSAIGRLGPGYARSFYRFAFRSPLEMVLFEESGGKVIAGCIATLAPTTLGRRMALGTPLLLQALFRPLAFPWDSVIGDIFGAAGRADLAVTIPENVPELAYIFTRKDERGNGFAGRLLRRLDDELIERGIGRYIVHTFDDPADPAVRFYQRNGLTVVGRRRARGMWFLVLERRLSYAGG
jgi:GNAT superfamily N-acetyltransferase